MPRPFADGLMFEQWLHREFAVKREDVLDNGVHQDAALVKGMAVRPDRALKMLGITEEGLVTLLKAGVLPPPADRGGARVAWRADEVRAAIQWLDDNVTSTRST